MSNVARKQRQCLYITLPKESSLNLLHTRLTITIHYTRILFWRCQKGLWNCAQSWELHLSKAKILMVLVMTFGPLSHLKDSPKTKDVFYINFSNVCITMLCREYFKILLWKFSLSLSHHKLQRRPVFWEGIFHAPHWRTALASGIIHHLSPFLSHVPVIPCPLWSSQTEDPEGQPGLGSNT